MILTATRVNVEKVTFKLLLVACQNVSIPSHGVSEEIALLTTQVNQFVDAMEQERYDEIWGEIWVLSVTRCCWQSTWHQLRFSFQISAGYHGAQCTLKDCTDDGHSEQLCQSINVDYKCVSNIRDPDVTACACKWDQCECTASMCSNGGKDGFYDSIPIW